MNRRMRFSLFLLISGIALQSATAQIHVSVVASSAGFAPGLPAMGSLASIGLTGLTGIQGIQSVTGCPLPYEFAGVSVTVNGTPAPILAVAELMEYQQINIQVPFYQTSNSLLIMVPQSGQVGQLDAGYYAAHAAWE